MRQHGQCDQGFGRQLAAANTICAHGRCYAGPTAWEREASFTSYTWCMSCPNMFCLKRGLSPGGRGNRPERDAS
eukprot:15655871-Heterocapsa_arctica.AAC.1